VADTKGTAKAGDEAEAGSSRAKEDAKNRSKGAVGEARRNPVSRLVRFVREVVAELRKVIWPTRKELVTYTAVVVVFVVIMVSLVAALDLGFAKAVLLVFGGAKSSAG
jgi:preprotein translocase subunit SecE